MTDGSGSHPEELLRLAREGDNHWLGKLLEVYRNYLTMLARLHVDDRLRSKVDSSDVVQEAFLEVHRTFASFRGSTEAEFLEWLRHILATKLATLVRRFLGSQQRDVRLERQLEVELDQSSRMANALVMSQSSPSQNAVRQERAVHLADALEQLPPHYRQVIVLRHFDELNFPEIARRMGRSLDSVKNLWARALASLNRVFKGESHECG